MVEVIKIGRNLKALRQQNGFSIRKLSLVLAEFGYPISFQTIYKWESDKIMPNIKSLNILSTIYNVGLESFFDDGSNVQSLSNGELKLISYLHTYKTFQKIVFLLSKLDKEEYVNGK